MQAVRGVVSAEIEGIATTQRSIELSDLYYQIDRWAMAQMSSIYFATLYVEDDGRLYGLFSRDNGLFRAEITVQNGEAQIGEMQAVQKVYEPVSRFIVRRQANGDIRFAMVACTAVVNRVGQIDSTTLFDNMIRRAEETGYYPKLDFYHLGGVHPAFEFGQFDLLARDGVAYVASGVMDKDHPLTTAILRSMDDGSASYGASIEYFPIAGAEETLEVDGLAIKVYTDGINTRISLLPEQQAASWFTTITTRSTDDMTKQQLDALRAAFGDDEELKKFLSGIAGTNERAQGLISRALEGDEPEVETPEAEEPVENADPVLEIDDATIGLIAAEVVRQIGEGALATVNGALEKQGKEIAGLTAKLDAIVATQRGVTKRIDALEADEEDKRATWLGDLPASRRSVTVTHRPRNERPVEDVLKTSADVAAATLAGLPMPAGLKT